MDKSASCIAKSTNDYVDGGDVSEGYKVLIDAIAGIVVTLAFTSLYSRYTMCD